MIHTVGPIVEGPLTQEHARLLASCYRSCLAAAAEHQAEVIAFPCISTGVFGYPKREAAETAVQTVRTFLANDTRIRKVIFNVYKDSDLGIYRELLGHD